MAEDETLDDEHEDDDGTDDEGEKTKKRESKEVVMSQRKYTSVMTREKDEGRRAGRRALLQELEVESTEDLKELVDAARQARDKDSSDSDKAKREADRARREADEARSEAKQARFETKVERMLIAADVPVKKVGKVHRMLDVTVDANDDELADAIDDLKEEYPELFRAESAGDGEGDNDEESPNGDKDRQTGLPRSDPGKQPRKKNPPANLQDQARSLLHERHPNLVRKD